MLFALSHITEAVVFAVIISSQQTQVETGTLRNQLSDLLHTANTQLFIP